MSKDSRFCSACGVAAGDAPHEAKPPRGIVRAGIKLGIRLTIAVPILAALGIILGSAVKTLFSAFAPAAFAPTDMRSVTTPTSAELGAVRPAAAGPTSDRQRILERELSYLSKIDEVAWVKFENNSVFVGLKRRPSDLKLIANAAASIGNRAMNFGCHVYFADVSMAPRPTSDGARMFCHASARYGEIIASTCLGTSIP